MFEVVFILFLFISYSSLRRYKKPMWCTASTVWHAMKSNRDTVSFSSDCPPASLFPIRFSHPLSSSEPAPCCAGSPPLPRLGQGL